MPEKKPSIWCISKYASPPRYGAGAKLYYTAKGFSELGADVLLISSDSNHLAKYPETDTTYNPENYGSLKHIWIKTLKYKRSASLRRILSWFDFELKLFRMDRSQLTRPDIVIISSLSLFTVLYGLHLKKTYNSKLVFEIRDIHPLTLTEECGAGRWNPLIMLMSWVEKLGYKKADLIVGTMPNLKQHVREVLGFEKEVFHSPLGIHQVWDNPSKSSDLVDPLFDGVSGLVVGYAGSMGVSNALMPFISAIKLLSEHGGISYVMVGEGDLKPLLAKELSGLPNVRIGPRIPQKDIPCFLSRCDILYLSTHSSRVWDYGQSMNKLVDYMMAGKPIVASYSGYPSMLNEANCGLFVPSDDAGAIVDAVLFFKNISPDERNEYGKRGKAWVDKFNNYKSLTSAYFSRLLSLAPQNETSENTDESCRTHLSPSQE